ESFSRAWEGTPSSRTGPDTSTIWRGRDAGSRSVARRTGSPSRSGGRTWRILPTVALSVAAPPVRRAWRTAQRRGLVGPTLIRADFARRVDLNERLRAAESARLGGGCRGRAPGTLASPHLGAARRHPGGTRCRGRSDGDRHPGPVPRSAADGFC